MFSSRGRRTTSIENALDIVAGVVDNEYQYLEDDEAEDGYILLLPKRNKSVGHQHQTFYQSMGSTVSGSSPGRAAMAVEEERSEPPCSDSKMHSLMMTLPRAFNNTDHKTNSFMTGLSILPFLQGAGILGVPYAFLIAGKAFLPAVMFIGFLGNVCSRLLIDSTYVKSRTLGRYRKYCSYEEVAHACWGKLGSRIMQVVNYTFLLMACVVNFVLLFFSLNQLFGGWMPYLHLTSFQFGSLFALVLIPILMFLSNASGKVFAYLGVLSTISIFVTTICSTVVFVYHHREWAANFDRLPVINWEQYPVALGIATLTIIVTPALPSIEGVMSKPTHFPTAIGVSFAFSSVFKTVYGLLGGLSFGLATQGLVADNVCGYSPLIRYTVSTMLVLNSMVNSVCYMQLVLMSLDKLTFGMSQSGNSSTVSRPWFLVWKLFSRSMSVAMTLAVTNFVPYFALVSSVIGALFGSFLAFIAPVYFHLTLKWRSMSFKERIGELVLLLFTIALCALMTFASVRELIKEVRKSSFGGNF